VGQAFNANGEQLPEMNYADNARTSLSRPLPYSLRVLFSIFFCVACSRHPTASPPAGTGPPVLTMMPTGENPADLAFLLSTLDQYRKRTAVQIDVPAAYDSVDDRIRLLEDLFAKRSPEPDICEIDNIWPGLLADDLVDLKPYLGDEMTAIDKSLLEAFTVNGRLVALPEFVETGVLYYRTDLLKKYGYRRPPETWDELGRMAKIIQDGERKAGAKDFWGYVWQGDEGEPLNCNALEWQRAEGAELINRAGTICANSAAAESALRRARSWVATISPPGVVEYDEEDSRNIWLAGSAAFARGWLDLYQPSQSSALLATRFSTAHMPAGSKGYGWMFGGMGLAVSRYSRNPKAAVEVVRYLISSAVQRQRLLASGNVPTRTILLSDAILLQKTGFNGWLSQHWREGMFARPSAQTGKKYAAVSRAYSKAVHRVISGKEDAHQALAKLQVELVSLLQSPRVASAKQ
jgi:trehalose/maltose transport system substrate-binding protein